MTTRTLVLNHYLSFDVKGIAKGLDVIPNRDVTRNVIQLYS
jgi:hypothetical protein